MDSALEDDSEKLSKAIPVLSDYVKGLGTRVKERYLAKISVIGVDPASIPKEQFNGECLPPIEVSDLLGYLVLETSHYTRKEFKAYKSLNAYNQMVSGFVQSVRGKLIRDKYYVVVGKVRHSQAMNAPAVDIWIITETDGTILSAHCLGCKAGLGETCTHVASVMFYIEAWTRIHGKLACTSVKCTWLLPTYVSEVNYAPVQDIDFSSARKLKENLDGKIDALTPNCNADLNGDRSALFDRDDEVEKCRPTTEELSTFYAKLNQCSVKPVALSLQDDYAGQFVVGSRAVPVITDLYETQNLDLNYPDLLRKCLAVKLEITEENIALVEKDTRSQAKCSSFYRHRAGRIGASMSGAASKCNLAKPPQSTIRTICYPHLFKVNTKAINHGCKYEDIAIKAYAEMMSTKHVNFKVEKCGLFINSQHPFLHASPDFLSSCDCCGLGCGEVKCPISIQDCDFDKYALKKSSCLEKVDGNFKLIRSHNYYYQVQQQLFTLKDRKHCDFVVCAIDNVNNRAVIVTERILPDKQHHHTVLPKLDTFWRLCILPEILGRWFTRRCNASDVKPVADAICFCRKPADNDVITCSNVECPYAQFHTSCLSLCAAAIPKLWYCPYCCRLPQFKRKRKQQPKQPPACQAALQLNAICTCKSKAAPSDKLLECHNRDCTNGKFFHLKCVGFKRMPNNAKTTWCCKVCKKTPSPAVPTTPPTTSTSLQGLDTAADSGSDSSSDSEAEDSVDADVMVTNVAKCDINKQAPLANLTTSDYQIILNPTGWLTCDIVHKAQVLLHEVNQSIEGFQRPTLGPVRNFDVVSGEFIQILHTGSAHWVCVSNIGCQPFDVNLYDSLYQDVICQEVTDQTNDLLGGHLNSLNYAPVQQQNNGNDCAIFAIAFACYLVNGRDPRQVTFDRSRMRSHLAECLRNGKMSNFPVF